MTELHAPPRQAPHRPVRAVTSVATGPAQRQGDPQGRALLLSLLPRHADAILSGTKTVELRRKTPTLNPGAVVVLYSSTPVKAIVGVASLTNIAELDPPELWDRHGSRSGVTSDEFDSYFEGTKTAYGLMLTNAARARCPVTLVEMRELGLTPPQSWRYLDAATVTELLTRMQPATRVNEERLRA